MRPILPQAVMVDSSFFYRLIDRSEHRHAECRLLFNALIEAGTRLFTTKNQKSVIEYFESAVNSWGATPGDEYPRNSQVFVRARLALLDGLLRLDELPRTDPFWETWANHRATMAKLGEYSARLLEENPADENVLWLSAALSLWHCSNAFGWSAWRGLHALGKFEPGWAIDAAATVELESGVPTIEALATLFRELGVITQARAHLDKVVQRGSSTGRAWALRVMNALN
jgi:predicted nucleic acid-binding protein